MSRMRVEMSMRQERYRIGTNSKGTGSKLQTMTIGMSWRLAPGIFSINFSLNTQNSSQEMTALIFVENNITFFVTHFVNFYWFLY